MVALSPSLASDAALLSAQVLEHIDDGMILFDDDNRILYFNRAAEQISGWSREEVIGRNLGLLAPLAMRERYDTQLHPGDSNRIQQLARQPHDIQLVRKDLSTRWISYAMSHIVLEDRPLRVAFIRDATLKRQQEERTRLLTLSFEETQNAVLISNGEGVIVQINKGLRQMLGWCDNSALGTSVIPMLLGKGASAERQLDYLGRLKAGESMCSDELLHSRDGKPFWCSVITNPIFDEYGELVNMVSVLTDITHTKIQQVLQNRMLDAMVREKPTTEIMQMLCQEVERIAPSVVASVLRVDDEQRLRTLAAPSLPESYCRALDGVKIGPSVGSCGTAAFTGQSVVTSDIANDSNWEGISHLALDNGLAACWSTPIMSSTGRVLGTFAFYYKTPGSPDPLHQLLVDVSVHVCSLTLEREETRNRIRRLAFYDELTGLPNRSLLHAQADQSIISANNNGSTLAVLFIDLDRFKQINDSLGHPAGDEVLRAVSQRLQDDAGPQDIVGRLAGDEFVMVLNPCDAGSAAERIERIQRRLSEALPLADMVVRPSASIGVSMYPHDGTDMETLLHRADMAMYQAKHRGSNNFSFYSPEMDRLAQERITLEAALRDALETGQLQLHYQPQIEVSTGVLRSVEALSRWHHPSLGNIAPMRFIPLAEECGLIDDLSRWALREACQQLARWRQQGLHVPSVSVNLSPTNFHDLELPGKIQQILELEALDAASLTVEITEDVLLDGNPATLQTLHAIRDLGVRLSMDDFGTGYSSLSYLRQLPISELKLDRSFVQDIERDGVASALTGAILHLGQSLKLDVVAEGVETAEQLRLLGDQGYDIVQGFHFTGALPPEQLAQWVQQRL
jgi:diguanylate cyclase (GGDEF)-like protein/PAS domain S-box-containing protein